MTDTYKIKIGINEFEVEGDKDWVEGKLAEFKEIIISTKNDDLGATVQPAPVVSSTQPTPPSVPTQLSTLAQFFREKGEPRRHNEKVVVFAYYLTKSGMESYNIHDIEQCYDEIRITKPANFSDVMNSVNVDYLVIAPNKDDRKAWIISYDGEKHVEAMEK